MKSKKLKFFIFLIFGFFIQISQTTDDYSDLVVSNADEARARMIMMDGNIYFHAGKDKNITFRVNEGSSILFGKTDIQKLPNTHEISYIRDQLIMLLTFSRLRRQDMVQLNLDVSENKGTIAILQNELKNLRSNLTAMNKRRRNGAKTRQLINALSENVLKVAKMIQTNDCLKQPCRNGGTCIDLVAKYQCLCPGHFEGKDCEIRIDECEIYSKAGIGCQNNGTCQNNGNLPGFTCKCPKGFHGRRCETKLNTCDAGLDLCGEHGHCLPKDGGYKCICEFGFKSDEDPDNPTCVDIDECSKNPCYPGSGCENIPGGFKCTSCPPGLIGNGIHCADFDECAEELSNDCSKNPRVQCINTFGSYLCGPCPPGYEGDGKKCIGITRCESNPCHHLATCTEDPVFACTCPSGYSGNGVGVDGCVKDVDPSGMTPCIQSNCENGGTCYVDQETGNELCKCPLGFAGNTCQFNKPLADDVCQGNPCGENGNCVNVNGHPRCECNKGFYGTKCQFQQDTCGFYTHNETGVIEYKREIKILELKDTICTWSIQLFDTSKILEFKFENFSIPKLYAFTSKGCRYGFANLTIFDGLDTDRPEIANFCHGDNLAPNSVSPFYTSGNAAKLLFNIRLHSSDTYLKISWKAVNPRCGGRYTASSGTISYFDVHDEDLCAFYISVPPQYHLEVTIKSVKMATGDTVNCTVNSLELFDHQSASNRTRLVQVCETQSEALVFRTTTSFTTIYFMTDRLATGEDGVINCKQNPSPWCGVGFVVSYRSIELPPGCGGTIYPDASGKMSGYIESPNYGHNYFPNLSCNWILNATSPNSTGLNSVSEEARKVKIEFVDFDIATNEIVYASRMTGFKYERIIRNCNGDYVRMIPKGGVFCNRHPPKGIYYSPYFDIKMVTDASMSGKGFKLKYESVCAMDFTAKNGTISSPNYPSALNYPFKCTYNIIAHSQMAIKVTFKYIGLKTDINTCFYNTTLQNNMEDYIEFSGGHKSSQQINRRYVCARYPFIAPHGEIITSGIRPLSITYSTTGNPLRNQGFSFDYEIVNVGCGGIFMSSTGVIKSPGYPDRYEPHMYCIYEIMVESTKSVRLTFDVFDLENVANQEGCGFDSVQVYDGVYVDEDNHGPLLGSFCGLALPPSLMSTGNKMAVVFLSDRSVNGAGFSANYRSVNIMDDCDKTFTDSNGIIEFNVTKHPRATMCDYVILLPQMHRISLTFQNVTIPCDEGSLLVRNGMNEQSPAFPGISEICGYNITRQLITQGNRAFIKFKSTSPSTAQFRIQYEQFVSGCGGRVTGVSGFISAPQYPLKDSRTLSCEWRIAVGEGNKIKLTFPFIDDLDSADTRGYCNSFAPNHLDIYDGTDSDTIIKRYCTEQTSTSPIISSSNVLTVKYVQHGGSYHGALFGFLGHFTTECNDVVLTGFHGSIQSPGYPGPIDPNGKTNCKWTIKTSPGNRIRVVFHKFKQNDINLLCTNYIQFSQSQILNFTSISLSKSRLQPTKFCNDYIPNEVLSKNNTLTIEYKSNKPDPENLFWLTYTTVGCGGIILRNNSEMFANYDDFVPDSTSRECRWTIKAPVGFVVKVDIEYGYFMGDPDGAVPCDDPIKTTTEEKDGIEFTNFLDSNGTGYPQKIFCGVIYNKTFTSYGNEIHALMRLSKKNIMKKDDGGIFKAAVTFVKLPFNDTSCGGVVELGISESAVIHSPNYPNAYPKGIECVWEFRAPEGHTVDFGIKEYRGSAMKLYYGKSIIERTTNCPYGLNFLDGSLSFYKGSYDREIQTQNGVLDRICIGINETQVISTNSRNATVIFRGSPQEQTHSSSSEDSKPPGFTMRAWVKCGGTLYAKQEAQTIFIRRPDDNTGNFGKSNETTCTYKFEKDDEAEGDTLYIKGERIPFNDGVATIWPFIRTAVFNMTCGDTVIPLGLSSLTELNTANKLEECEDNTVLSTDISKDPNGMYMITYGLENTFCGGTITAHHRFISYKINPKKPADCEWFFTATPGFNVSLMVPHLQLPTSELCQDSYIEVKTDNNSGIRQCDDIKARRYNSQNITVRFRYRPPEDDDDVDDVIETTSKSVMFLRMMSTIVTDQYPVSPIIESPKYSDIKPKTYTWHLRAKQNDSIILVNIDKLNMPEGDEVGIGRLKLQGLECRSNSSKCPFSNCQSTNIVGYIDEGLTSLKRCYPAQGVEIIYSNHDSSNYFRLQWKEIDEHKYNQMINEKESKKSKIAEDYTCGGDLIPTYDPQYLESPKNAFGLYADNLKCRWRIKKPLFANINIKIISVDLESHPKCVYDYLGVAVQDYSPTDLAGHHSFMLTYCKGNSTGNPMSQEYNVDTFIYFVTDRSRGGPGFKIEYSLGCKSYEYIRESESPISMDLTSPRYPDKYEPNLNCFWGIILASTRQMNVTVEFDIEGNDGNCGSDFLIMSHSPTPYFGSQVISTSEKKKCGRMSYREVFSGRMFVYFISGPNQSQRKGFKIHIEEVMVDCSSNHLWIDEINPSKQLMSPDFPKMSPNSLDCNWVINAPPGHRIKFTVDPVTFLLQNSDPDECIDDYLEIHDGASVNSPLIGKYCESYAPSTIYSTGSSLFVVYVTDSYVKSMGFNATYELASCGGSIVLRPGIHENVQSPNYPDPYDSKSQCAWTVKAPPGHFVQAKMNHIWLTYSENCTQDYVQIRDNNATGNVIMPAACSRLQIQNEGYQSEHNSMYVEFNANTSNAKMTRMFCTSTKCGFDLDVTSTEFSCGGDITDDEGMITLPGYPEKIIKHVSCEWRFDAGLGSRYIFQFSFLNEENGYYLNSRTDHCYPDLEIFNGPPRAKNNLVSQHKRFCSNMTTFISMADLVTISYQDQANNWINAYSQNYGDKHFLDERFYKPWKITYKKVSSAFNKEGCSSLITRNVVMRVGNLTVDSNNQIQLGARTFCHLRLQRPSKAGTTMLQFSEIQNKQSMIKRCDQSNRIVITDTESDPWPIDEIICNATSNTNETTYVYPNPKIEVYVINNPHKTYFDVPIEFKLTVKFYKCGGIIDGDETQSGTITSPNFGEGNVYSKNDYCLWYLKAPEGQTIQLEFEFMDIENHVECQNDYLSVAEGQGFHSVIHRYCASSSEPIPERFKIIRSRGSEMSLLWKTDNNIQRKGFNLTYQFIHYHSDEDPGCGFSSHAMSGLIESPNYPKDYPNNIACIWNLIVPFGYHVKLNIITLDVQNSYNCQRDILQISQEHQSRALTPLGEYYFYFEHEEVIKTICGNDQHPPIIAESNHVRVNFTTDDSISGRGFKLSWEAVCGTTMSLTHGVITSPHYPNYYPNDNLECDYLIFPILPDNSNPIVTLRVLDFNLETFAGRIRGIESTNLSLPCIGDYLEIIDVSRNKSLMQLCGMNMGPATESPAISVHGAIGVKFVVNRSIIANEKKKNYRGFKLTYAVADCGGEIVLVNYKDKLSATIYSPGFPLPYHHNLNCVWNITAPEDRVISAKFLAVDTEGTGTSSSCIFDYIELFDGITTNFSLRTHTQNDKFMGRFCGEAIPKDYLVTTGPNMTVRFKSDHSSSNSGFKMVVTATLGPKNGCGGNLTVTEEEKTLTPPLDNKGKYFNGLRCLWRLKTENPKKLIEFKFTQMHLEQRRRVARNVSSCYDFVAIYDGSRPMSSFLLQPTCKVDDLPIILQSSYRVADVYFESDFADSYDGFSLTYRAIDDKCGGNFAAASEPAELAYESEKTLTRTNQKHKRCRWHFYAKEGQPVVIDFKSFSFPSDDPTCPFEFVEIRDVGVPAECQHPACGERSENRPVLRYCGKIPPTRYLSMTSVVEITTSVLLQSQYSAKFLLNYMLLDECNRTIEIQAGSHYASGRLTSPNFPNTYDNNATCSTTLAAPQNYQIFIVFKTFKLERGENAFFVRHRIPGFGRFNRRYLNWRFRHSQPGITPLYDRGSIAVSQRCSYDYVKIILNPVTSDGVKTFCGYIMPPSLLSTSSEIEIELTTDESLSHGGYELSYYSLPKVKNIIVGSRNISLYEFEPNYERTGAITNVGYPSNYPNNTIQRFTVVPPSGLSCKFTFLALKTSNSATNEDCQDADFLMYTMMPIETWDSNKKIETLKMEWTKFPCNMDISSAETEIQETKGTAYIFSFTTDDDDNNNGIGFRIHWTCNDYEEEIL